MIEIRTISDGGVSIRHTEQFSLPDLILLTQEEAREVFNWLYDHFESLDREALAAYLTNHKKA